MSKLNPKQQAFVNEYLLSGNATEAAKKAGYSEKTAASQGSDLLKNANVSDAIKKATKKVAKIAEKKFNITKEVLIDQLAKIAFATPADIVKVDDQGRTIMRDPKDVDLSGFNFTVYPEYQSKADKDEGIVRAKLSVMSGDKKGAIELLGKYIGIDGAKGTNPDSRKAVMDRLQKYFSKNRRDGSGSST